MSANKTRIAGNIPRFFKKTSVTTLMPMEMSKVIMNILSAQNLTPFDFCPANLVFTLPFINNGGNTPDRPCSLGPVGFPYELLPVADRSGFPLKLAMYSCLIHDWIAV